jgi:hypothetical protein
VGVVSILTGDGTPAALARLMNYSFRIGAAKTPPWIAITDITSLGPSLQIGTKCMIHVKDERLTFMGCAAVNDADPTKFFATDVVDEYGNSVIG